MKKGVIVGIGTEDGRFVYELAKSHPDKLIIGIDSSKENLRKYSSKVLKKASRGGVKNILYIWASVSDLPRDLKEVANQVFINFPWGELLGGIVNVNEAIWRNIRMICKKGAYIGIILGYDRSFDRKEIERLNLPDLSMSYIKSVILVKLEEFDFKVEEIRELDSEILRKYPTSWAKKLSLRKKRNYYYIRLKKYSL